MALQQAVPSDIVPQKSLNDIDSMYYYLNDRLNITQSITDLIPFMQKLMNMNELKQHLKSSLNTKYESAKSKDKNESQLSSENNFMHILYHFYQQGNIEKYHYYLNISDIF